MFVQCVHDMLLILYVLDSLFFATAKGKRVLMHVWRHMLPTLWFVDSLFFATPKSKRVLMGTKVGGAVHGEGQRKRKSARRRAWRVSNLLFGFYALLAKRFSLPIRRVRGQEARCYTPKLGTVLRALLIHLIKPETFSVAYLFFGGRWCCCCLCVFCFGARTSP